MVDKKDGKRRPHFFDSIPEEALEHAKAARAEMKKSLGAFLPPDFVASHRTARKEMLMAAREFLNHAIDKIETQKQ